MNGIGDPGDELRRTLERHGDRLTDAALLACFVEVRAEAAFAALVRRHGPMVLGVCRRITGDSDDAEDAFQAAFLVLARRAGSVRPPEAVGNWLYGVAVRVARKARARARRLRGRERQVVAMPEPAAPEPGTDCWAELRPRLDAEIARLPDQYRAPIVLCDLEGKTRKEAARLLGWPEGSVAGRLARARTLLSRRIARTGVTVSGGVLATLLTRHAAAEPLPATLAASAAKAAALAINGKAGTALAALAVSAEAASLHEGALKAMLLERIGHGLAGMLTALLLAAGLTAAAFGRADPQPPADSASRPPQNVGPVAPPLPRHAIDPVLADGAGNPLRPPTPASDQAPQGAQPLLPPGATLPLSANPNPRNDPFAGPNSPANPTAPNAWTPPAVAALTSATVVRPAEAPGATQFVLGLQLYTASADRRMQAATQHQRHALTDGKREHGVLVSVSRPYVVAGAGGNLAQVVQTGVQYDAAVRGPVAPGRVLLDLAVQADEVEHADKDGVRVAGRTLHVVRLTEVGRLERFALAKDRDGRPTQWVEVSVLLDADYSASPRPAPAAAAPGNYPADSPAGITPPPVPTAGVPNPLAAQPGAVLPQPRR